MISNMKNILKKVKKNDIIRMTTEYSKEQNYIVEFNSPTKRVLRVIPLNMEEEDHETTISLSFAWEMIYKISFVDKKYILFFLNHSSEKISDSIKSILG
jgi:hypothetical protein